MTKRTNRRRCSDKHRRAGPSLPGNQSIPGGPKGRGTLDSQDSLSFERATLSHDDERRIASFEPRASVALLPVVLASFGFAECASLFQSAGTQSVSWQKRIH